MQFIAPKERFSQHAARASVSPSILAGALRAYGRQASGAEFRRLPGGFMNANFVANIEGERFVVRVYSTDAATADRECDLLMFLSSTAVAVPRVLARCDIEQRPVAILEFIDGVTLEDSLIGGGALGAQIYRDIGAQLAHVHRISFSRTGFVGPKVTIGHEYDDFSIFLRQFIDRTLSMLLTRPDRLSLDLNRRFQRLVRDRWTLVSDAEPRRQLVHSDFNPKNLMVGGRKDAVLAIIDWEFCLSGNGLADLGNFFRFEYDYPSDARAAFVEGYASVNGELPVHWFDVAKLIDLGAMCGFLERPEDYQESFRTARAVIESTLDHFGY
jgi:aminoglycoside phosphotransferase (APT) family kinase protein